MSDAPEASPVQPSTLTYGDAAVYLGISVVTLKRLVADGKVRHVRPTPTRVRFRLPDLDDYLDSVARGGKRRRGPR